MRKINYKYWYEGQPVALILPRRDYSLFQSKVAYEGMTVKAAVEYVLNSREARRLKQAALASKTIRDRFAEPGIENKAEKKFLKAGIARLERLYQKITGKAYPPPCPRPATSPKSLDVMYLTTRYGAIKLAIESIRPIDGNTKNRKRGKTMGIFNPRKTLGTSSAVKSIGETVKKSADKL